MQPEWPVTFVSDDDALLWAVSTSPDTSGWLVIRTDGDRPEVEQLSTYVCTAAHWHLAGHQGWPVAGSLDDRATWQLFRPGEQEPWGIEVEGVTRSVYPPGSKSSADPDLNSTVPQRDVTEALSWRLAAELARRHPGDLWIAHTVPIVGTTYDCLTLVRPGDRGQIGPPIFDLNRGGSIHLRNSFAGQPFEPEWPRWSWQDYLDADPYRFLRQLEDRAGLPSLSGVPATTPATLVWRLIASLVGPALRSVHRIEAVPGFADTAWDASPNDELFQAFPRARQAVAVHHPADPLGTPHRRFWFICVDDDPRVVLSTEGRAWGLGDVEYDLMNAYDTYDRRLGPVAGQLLQDIID